MTVSRFKLFVAKKTFDYLSEELEKMAVDFCFFKTYLYLYTSWDEDGH